MRRRFAFTDGVARLVRACASCRIIVRGATACPCCGAALVEMLATPTSHFAAEIDLPLPQE